MWRLQYFFIKHKTFILDRLKNIFIITLLLICQQIIFAQNTVSFVELNKIDKNLNETVFVTTNTNSFLTGETLLYKIFCLDKTTNLSSKYSKIAYFTIIASDKKVVCTQKLFLENGNANGDFFIPTSLETGTYKIVGYTSWMLNKNIDNYFTTDIYIINPYKEKLANTNIQNGITLYEPVIDPNIAFEIKNKTVDNRAPVEVKIKTVSDDFTKGNYTISVRKADGFSAQQKTSFKDYQIATQNKASDNTITNLNFVMPELRGEIITGRIKSVSGQIRNKKVALSIVGKNYNLKLAKTDEQGQFLFNLEKSNPNPNVIVQLLEEDKENYTIEIDKTKQPDFSSLTFSNLQSNSESNKNITERLISTQVENAYYNRKKDSLITPDQFVAFFGSLTTEYKFDDFTRFSTMEETITEIITGVVFRKEGNRYRLIVYDYDKNFDSTLSPLVTVDGLILEDLNEFFTYNPKNLYKVNVVKGLYYYGSKSFNGLVSFATKNGDYETSLKGSFIIRPEFLRPISKKEYFQPNYTNNKNERIPDYRHQLLWLPNVDLNNKSIQFYTSDVSGKFEVILEGFSASGKPVYIKDIIEVRETVYN